MEMKNIISKEDGFVLLVNNRQEKKVVSLNLKPEFDYNFFI